MALENTSKNGKEVYIEKVTNADGSETIKSPIDTLIKILINKGVITAGDFD